MLTSGIILIWSGSIGSIPAGYVLCDGDNGTPDLRNRFIVGAGDTYNVGDIGGFENHNHTFTSNFHDHQLEAGIGVAAGTFKADFTTSVRATGTTNNSDGRPPYFALAYIMKT